jgi:hypothetical protein
MTTALEVTIAAYILYHGHTRWETRETMAALVEKRSWWLVVRIIYGGLLYAIVFLAAWTVILGALIPR